MIGTASMPPPLCDDIFTERAPRSRGNIFKVFTSFPLPLSSIRIWTMTATTSSSSLTSASGHVQGFDTNGESIIIGKSKLRVSFRRTVRVTDGKERSMLPGDLGSFPIYSALDIQNTPNKLRTTADFVFPMYGEFVLPPVGQE